ncbi:uncharacterized protein V6R79_011212 [Siganus canaliculatus]
MAGFYFLGKLSVLAVLLCSMPAAGFVYQGIYDCEYGSNITDMVFLVKNIINQKIHTLYDSRVGKYVGFGERGMTDAAHYNGQAWKMKERREAVDKVCRHSARLFRESTLDRNLPPTVSVSPDMSVDYGKQSTLMCSVMGFYPHEIRVRWLLDGVEVPDGVSATDVLPNGDWTFQLHSYLEFVPRRGQRVTCSVDHRSLRERLEVDWDTDTLDAQKLKLAVGITVFFLGFTVAAVGAVYYWWKRRSDFSPLGSVEQTSPCHL